MLSKTGISSNEGVPLTPMQLGMISESVASGMPWVNIEQVVVHFSPTPIADEEVSAGLGALRDRYDALRVMLYTNNVGRLGQSFEVPGPIPYDVLEQEALSDTSWQTDLENFLEADRLRGFDLVGRPLWRASLLRWQGQKTVLVLTMHHAIADGRSMARLARELIEYLRSGALPSASSGTMSFEAFCKAASSFVPNEDATAAYFRTYLKDIEDAGALSFVNSSEIVATGVRKRQLVASLPPDDNRKLAQAAALLGGTTANMVQAAWGTLISRWQGKDAVTFGVVRSGRHAFPDTEATVGCLINTLPTCVKLSADLTVAALVTALRDHTLSLHSLEQTPPDLIRKSIGLHGSKPLFETAIMFENAAMEDLITGGEKSGLVDKVELREEGGLPLMLSAYAGSALKLQLEYDPSIISEALAGRLFAHLERLMHALSQAGENTKVGDLDMLEPDEKQMLLEWSKPDVPLQTTATCLIELFQDAVNIAPESIALKMIDGRAEVTFAELDRRSDHLAHILSDHGAAAGEVVAINLDRSADFVVAVIAALKTGAAFMPVDPAHPHVNRAHMVSDSGARIIVQNDGVIVEGIENRYPKADRYLAAPFQRPAKNPAALAYVIYTSGSTGTPKGVQVSRGNLMAHIAALTSAFEMQSSDRTLQFAGLSFDVAIEEIFTTLMAGATLVLRSDEMSSSTAVLLEEIEAERLSVINLPTAYWTVLNSYMHSSGRALPPSVRLVIVGGEAISSTTLSEWLKIASGARFLNGYGPTETTITCALFEPINHSGDNDICIGRPTAHALAYVITPDGSLSPKGALGELAIGGPAVTQGYIGRPDATAKAFGPNKFSGKGSVYRTGDRGQWRGDGNLQFRGRKDRQIKLRGHRIELAHVERVVEQCIPDGEIMCDVLDKNKPSAQLVVWIAAPEAPDLARVDACVSELLPGYMRPRLVHIPAFPRTLNGKVDRAALPRPVQKATSADDLIRPASPLETQICQIMAAVLNLPQVDPDQSFFDLGGHSLLSLELIGRIQIETGKKLGIVDFRVHPSPRALTKMLETSNRTSKNIIPIQPLGSNPPLLAIHILGANEEYFRPLAKHLGVDQPVMGISVGSLAADTPTGVETIAARYCAEINEHFPNGPIHLMAASLGSYIAFELAQQLQRSGRKVDTLAFFDASGPDGRSGIRGLKKLKARFRRARYVGWRYPAKVVQNLIYEARNRLAQYKMRLKLRNEHNQSPKTVFEFIAANELAVNEYTPKPITIPLTLFRSAINFYDTKASTETGLGWASVAESGFSVIDIPGGHLSMLQEPTVSIVADELKVVLDLR